MFCIKCGTQNPEGTSFCTKCGASMSSAAGGPPPTPGFQAGPSPETQSVTQMSHSALLNIISGLLFLLGFIGAILAATSMEDAPGKVVSGTFIGVMFYTLVWTGGMIFLAAIASRRR